MLMNDYMKEAMKTRKPSADLTYAVFKLCGEAGEVAEKFGKQIRDYGGDFYEDSFKDSAIRELGDVLWYIAAIAQDMDFTLEQVAQVNLDKLSDRSTRGVIGGSGDYR